MLGFKSLQLSLMLHLINLAVLGRYLLVNIDGDKDVVDRLEGKLA